MHATPPPHCHPAVFAPVVRSVFLSLVLCWQMLCHRALLQEILRAQKALLQAATASQSVQCPAPTTEDRHDPCSGHAMNVDSDHKVLHLRLAHALLGLVDGQALQWPSASEQRSASDDFRTETADRLRRRVRSLCLPTFSHFLIVNKLLSLSLSLSSRVSLAPLNTWSMTWRS